MDRPAACTVRASGVIIVTADEGGGVTANPAGEWTVQQARDLGMILGERHLRAVLAGYRAHCNMARPHLGIAQRAPDGDMTLSATPVTGGGTQRIRRKSVLGGLINECTHAA